MVKLFACGDNSVGQHNIPPLDEGISYSQVSAGDSHTVLLRSDGQAVARGWNSDGQCNIPSLRSWRDWLPFGFASPSYRYICDSTTFAMLGKDRVVQVDCLLEGDGGVILTCVGLDGLEVLRLKAQKSDRIVDVCSRVARELNTTVQNLRMVFAWCTLASYSLQSKSIRNTFRCDFSVSRRSKHGDLRLSATQCQNVASGRLMFGSEKASDDKMDTKWQWCWAGILWIFWFQGLFAGLKAEATSIGCSSAAWGQLDFQQSEMAYLVVSHMFGAAFTVETTRLLQLSPSPGEAILRLSATQCQNVASGRLMFGSEKASDDKMDTKWQWCWTGILWIFWTRGLFCGCVDAGYPHITSFLLGCTGWVCAELGFFFLPSNSRSLEKESPR